MFLGDFAVGATLDHFFTTRRFSTGAPFTLAGTPVISAYEDNSTTEITAGVTLTVDFDARTGLNHVRVVASGANGFETGKSYYLVITTGTVDSVSVVGEVVGSFTLERGAAFGRLGAPAGASIAADLVVIDNFVDDIEARLPTALVSGRMDSSVGAYASGMTPTRPSASGTADSGSTTTLVDAERTEADTDYWRNCILKFTSGTLNGQTALITAFNAATDTITFAPASTVAVATHTYEIYPMSRVDVQLWLGVLVNALISGRVDANTQAMANAVISALTFAANALDAAALAQDAGREIADEVLNRDIAGSASGGARNVRSALRRLRNRVAIAAGTATVYQENDTTADWTAAVTTTAGDPVSQIDPT